MGCGASKNSLPAASQPAAASSTAAAPSHAVSVHSYINAVRSRIDCTPACATRRPSPYLTPELAPTQAKTVDAVKEPLTKAKSEEHLISVNVTITPAPPAPPAPLPPVTRPSQNSLLSEKLPPIGGLSKLHERTASLQEPQEDMPGVSLRKTHTLDTVPGRKCSAKPLVHSVALWPLVPHLASFSVSGFAPRCCPRHLLPTIKPMPPHRAPCPSSHRAR